MIYLHISQPLNNVVIIIKRCMIRSSRKPFCWSFFASPSSRKAIVQKISNRVRIMRGCPVLLKPYGIIWKIRIIVVGKNCCKHLNKVILQKGFFKQERHLYSIINCSRPQIYFCEYMPQPFNEDLLYSQIHHSFTNL